LKFSPPVLSLRLLFSKVLLVMMGLLDLKVFKEIKEIQDLVALKG
jgi:hypothetical protein